jgi:hypothetical protein
MPEIAHLYTTNRQLHEGQVDGPWRILIASSSDFLFRMVLMCQH